MTLKLGVIASRDDAKRVKRSNKKQVKCFLCRDLHELQNCLEQSKLAEVKRKAMTELVESSEGLPSKEELSLASNLVEEVAMETLKLGPMRLNLRKAKEFVESSTRLPAKEEMSCACKL